MQISKLRELYTTIFILVFIGMLLLPLRTFNLNPNTIEDDFYLRTRLVSLTTDLRLAIGDRVFTQVLIGKDGWLVYNAEGDLDVYERTESFSEQQLAQFQNNLDNLAFDYAKRGITLVVVVAPSKNTIYPEYIPSEINQFSTVSKLDQVVSYLNVHGSTNILDPRPALLEASTKQQMYYATDTHWNDYGRHLAYSLVMEQLSGKYPNLTPRPLSDFIQQPLDPMRFDLAEVLGTNLMNEASTSLTPAFDLLASFKVINAGGRRILFSNTGDESLPNLVAYYDSYFVNITPLLAEHFNRGIFVQNYIGGGLWDLSWVDQQKPDVVIIEIAERQLDGLFKLIDPNQ